VGRTKTIDDEAILEHARAIFRAHGPSASTRDVASAAGISQAVLFQRFGSKEEMFLRAATPAAPDLESLLGPYPPQDVRDDLVRIGERLATYLRSLMPTLLHVVAHSDLAHARLLDLHRGTTFHPLLSALGARFARMRDDGLIAKVEVVASAQAFLALVHSAVFFELMAGAKSKDRHASHVDPLVHVLWKGLAPPTVRRRRTLRARRKKA
jgi:AcrR family transcriptional regulator